MPMMPRMTERPKKREVPKTKFNLFCNIQSLNNIMTCKKKEGEEKKSVLIPFIHLNNIKFEFVFRFLGGWDWEDDGKATYEAYSMA